MKKPLDSKIAHSITESTRLSKCSIIRPDKFADVAKLYVREVHLNILPLTLVIVSPADSVEPGYR